MKKKPAAPAKKKNAAKPRAARPEGAATVELLSPARGAAVTSPLAVVTARFAGARARAAFVRVGGVEHVVELDGPAGVLRENVTLLEGKNRIEVEVDGAKAAVTVDLPRSERITLGLAEKAKIGTRAVEVTGTFENVSCPAGVIAVNGFLQQFALQGVTGGFAEKVVLRAGANHLAVQIGELYATRRLHGTFAASKALVTLVWNTNATDVDLHVDEPSGEHVYFGHKVSAKGGGSLDVDRVSGFGPENYSLGVAGGKAPPGVYAVRLHYFADRGIGRTEWTARVLTEEGLPGQRRKDHYGILNRTGEGVNVCRIQLAKDGTATVLPPP